MKLRNAADSETKTTMSSEYTPSGSRRSSRRGDRRPRGNDRPSSHTRRDPAQPPKKKTLIEKIVGFFAPKPDPAPRKASPATAPDRQPVRDRERERANRERPDRNRGGHPERAERSERPERPPRGERPTGMRKPEIVEVTSPRLYVGNLSFDAVESDLSELFGGVGTVQNVEIVMNRHTMRSKGFGFVQMQSVDDAKRAVAELHDKEYMGGRKLVVSGAKAVDERRSERNRGADPQEDPQPESGSQPEQ
jgi:RNA recognition motif-containing protein